MLVVFTFHAGDRHQAVPLAHYIQALGSADQHECLLVHPTNTTAEGIEEPLRQAFRSVETVTYQETMQGWPFGPNEIAFYAIRSAMQRPQPYYLMLEPDCVPTTARWLDILDIEYRRCGKSILGMTVDTVEIATGRRIGRHTVGVAVYPREFGMVCTLTDSLVRTTQAYHRAHEPMKPWDAYFGPYTAPNTAQSELIWHSCNSTNYRRENDQTVCDPNPLTAPRIVNPNAVIVHGQKDGSMMALLNPKYDTPNKSRERTPNLDSPAAIIQTVHREIRLENGEANDGGVRSSFKEAGPADCQPATPLKKESKRWPKPTKYPFATQFPFPSPEGRRCCALFPLPFAKLREYAISLGIKTSGGSKRKKGKRAGSKTADAIRDEVVLEERFQMKEAWTKELQPAAKPSIEPETNILPPPPPSSIVPPLLGTISNSKPSESGEYSDDMKRRMLALRERRLASASSVPS